MVEIPVAASATELTGQSTPKYAKVYWPVPKYS